VLCNNVPIKDAIGAAEMKGRNKMNKAKYVVIANGKTYTFETLAAARYFAAEHNTTPVRVNW
jgi:hypothetical protein